MDFEPQRMPDELCLLNSLFYVLAHHRAHTRNADTHILQLEHVL